MFLWWCNLTLSVFDFIIAHLFSNGYCIWGLSRSRLSCSLLFWVNLCWLKTWSLPLSFFFTVLVFLLTKTLCLTFYLVFFFSFELGNKLKGLSAFICRLVSIHELWCKLFLHLTSMWIDQVVNENWSRWDLYLLKLSSIFFFKQSDRDYLFSFLLLFLFVPTTWLYWQIVN